MCGINGFNFRDELLIQKMNEETSHRGPDDGGFAFSNEWSLGHNRLSIIDLSEAGHQPMESREGDLAIVFNGEIYNFIEIRRELEEEFRFVSKTDTEVLLYAYRKWGSQCLGKLNGMFAFAILDRKREEVFIARDRIGIKPLYYYWKNGKFIFSSEIKAILAHDIPRELDYKALNINCRMLYVPAPYTVIKETRRIIKDSVRLELVSDRPVGIFLSGGIDSTIIAGVASEYSRQIQTFSAGFEKTEEEEKYNNDMKVARETSKYFGTKHHEFIFSAKDVIDAIPESIYHMDEPISNHVQAVNMLLARHVSKEATVVLGGDGGDELFGGYERYYYNYLLDRIGKVPFDLGRVLGKFLRNELNKKLSLQDGAERYLSFFAQKENIISEFFSPALNQPDATFEIFNNLYFQEIMPDFTRQFMRTDVLSWLPSESLVRSDKMSMAAGIEQRVPLLDHRLVELADRIPFSMKLGGKGLNILSRGRHYRGKRILTEAMREYLPDFVIDQPKWGWFSPAAKWIRGPLLPLMREVLSPDYNKETKHMFDFKVLNRILDDHVSKKQYALNTLWSVMTFQIWYRKFIK